MNNKIDNKNMSTHIFFKIAKAFHFDLQIVLINRLCGVRSDLIALDDCLYALKKLADTMTLIKVLIGTVIF